MVKKQNSISYLSSYPKSGNSWVRFILANIYNHLSPAFDGINFINIHEIIPELGKGITPHYNEFPLVYKTHAPFNREFKKVILLVRNPYDCLFSYYHFLNGELKLEMSIEEVVKSKTYGMDSLVLFINSYLKMARNMLVVRYEDLLKDPATDLTLICEFIGLNVSNDIIQKAIDLSTFGEMKDIEKKIGRKFGNPEFEFVRRGTLGEGKAEIEKIPQLDLYIREKCLDNDLLRILYF